MRSSLSNRAHDAAQRRHRHRSATSGNNKSTSPVKSSAAAPGSSSATPESPVYNGQPFPNNKTSNHSPPPSPQEETASCSSSSPNHSNNRRSRTPAGSVANRPPLMHHQQQQVPASIISSGSWDEPPDLRSVSSERAPLSHSHLTQSQTRGHNRPHPAQRNNQSSSSPPPIESSNRSVVSDTAYFLHKNNSNDTDEGDGNEDEDIPMDERSADIRSYNNGGNNNINGGRNLPNHSSSSPRRPTSVNVSRFPPGRSLPPTNNTNSNSNSPTHQQHHHQDDDVSSLGGVEENNLAAMTVALRSKATTMHGLSAEERILWDTVQVLLQDAAHNKEKEKENSNNNNNNEEALLQMQEKMLQQQQEQERAMRAIQRVLADVTEERDRAQADLATAKDEAEEKKQDDEDRGMSDSAGKSREREQELRRLRNEVATKTQEISELQESYAQSKKDKEAADAEVDSQKKQIAKLKRHLIVQRSSNSGSPKNSGNSKEDTDKQESSSSDEEYDDLKKQLDEKTAALENAKMIITSLENASGSLASDTRLKLKAKDTEVATLKTDLQQYKKKLDTLATELRDAQRATAESDELKNHLSQQSAELAGLLDATLTDLRSASVILETTHDPSSIQNLAELFEDCSESLQRSLDVFDGGVDEDQDGPKQQHHRQQQQQQVSEAESKALQEEVKKLKEEALHFRLEAERVEKQRDSDVKTLYAEIKMLRVECSTNMEVLTKKERELAVLRDSLKVEDEEVGYISDDATEADEDEDGNNDSAAPPPPPPPPSYGPSQAEALATLLEMGQQAAPPLPPRTSDGNAEESTERLMGELSQARSEKERALKELKTEKESLANAKMIISSLEKSNKSMMEDLRSRLHDSNTAIASLLEKSMESEKSAAKMQEELEALRRQQSSGSSATPTEIID